MSNSQDSSRGFLPPTPTTSDHHHEPPSSFPNCPPGFTVLPLPQTPPKTTTQDSDLKSVIEHAIFNIRNAVTANASTTFKTKNPTRRNKPNVVSSKTRNNPRRRTVSDAVPSRKRNRVVYGCLNDRNIHQIKRLRKMEELVMEMEQKCQDITSQSQDQGNVEDDSPSEEIVERGEGGEECVGFKRLDGGDEECIGFKRLEDGAVRIQMRCSCSKRFEVLHNDIGCFYRLI